MKNFSKKDPQLEDFETKLQEFDGHIINVNII